MTETGLFDIQAGNLRSNRQAPQLPPNSRDVIHALFGRADLSDAGSNVSARIRADVAAVSENKSAKPNVQFAECFLRLANLPNFALDRLSRYETMLWRQAGRILFALDALDRRKPQERGRRSIRTSRVFSSTGDLAE
jgi:hypothetical protein